MRTWAGVTLGCWLGLVSTGAVAQTGGLQAGPAASAAPVQAQDKTAPVLLQIPEKRASSDLVEAVEPPAHGGLARRGLLGLRAEADDNGRIIVTGLAEDGAGARAGLKPGDVIVAINGAELADWAGFEAVTATLEAGRTVPVTLQRGGEAMELALTPDTTPIARLENARVEAGAVTYARGLQARTFVTLPDHSAVPPEKSARRGRGKAKPEAPEVKPPFAGVMLVQGIPCATVETLANEAHPYTRLIRRLNAAGFATLRVEKPGVGDSQGEPCTDGGFNREVDAMAAGLKAFRAREDIDPARVYAIGISMGGIQAPLLAAREGLAGIVTFGTGVQPWYDYTVNNFRERWLLQGQAPEQIDQTMRLWRRYFAQMLIFRRSPREIALEDPRTVEALRPLLGEDLDRFAGRHYTFHQELDGQDLASAWGAFDGNVLAVHGEYDWVASLNDHRMIVEIHSRHSEGRADFEIIEGMDHGFTTHDSLKDSFANPFRGERSDAFHERAVEWLTKEAGLK